jgi:post-segregation antitoxin (ccd killing protein)
MVIFDHGAPGKARPDATAALNSLVFSAPVLAKRTIQEDLWNGHKANDLNVTTALKVTLGVTAAKAKEWKIQENYANAAWDTTSRGAALEAALGASAALHDVAAAEASGVCRKQVCPCIPTAHMACERSGSCRSAPLTTVRAVHCLERAADRCGDVA